MMEELSHDLIGKEIKDDLTILRRSSGKMSDSVRQSIGNLKGSDFGSGDDEASPRTRFIKCIKRFSDSDSDSGRENMFNRDVSGSEKKTETPLSTLQSSNCESDASIFKTVPHRTRIQRNEIPSSTEDSESENASQNEEQQLKNQPVKLKNKFISLSSRRKKEPILTNTEDEAKIYSDNESDTHKSHIPHSRNLSDSDKSGSDDAVKNDEQQLRMKNKRNMLQNKFKSLVTSRKKDTAPSNIVEDVNKNSDSDNSNTSDEEMASIEKIKQKIKDRMSSFKPSICDPDTSDEESSQQKSVYKQKKGRKMTKPTSPKPQRMSAKQAMENMQKIKSESNRMLREKEVSLPYHRPKALSLKDIMSRRKLAVSSNGKALPIKMNGEQLKQYAQMLEERQKEMMELCKSESEEETNENLADDDKDTLTNGNNKTKPDNTVTNENINNIGTTDTEIKENVAVENNLHENTEENMPTEKDTAKLHKDQDSDSSMHLVYNDSANSTADDKFNTDTEGASTSILGLENKNDNVTKSTDEVISKESVHENSETVKKVKNSEIVLRHEDNVKSNTEVDSQLIHLHLDTETTDSSIAKEQLTEKTIITNAIVENAEISDTSNLENNVSNEDEHKSGQSEGMEMDNEFSDDDINMVDIDNIIENAEIIKDIEDKVNSQFLIRDKPLNLQPKLTGGPGMIIDLDSDDAAPRKSGIELLKERFTYFSKLKTPEEMEREKEKKLKPGTQLKKLKQELEEKIAEQRSLEWAKRLENEKLQQNELKVLRGEESEEDDIDKIEAAIEGEEEINESEKSESEEEEEPVENDIEIKDKPRAKKAEEVDDEAEESDCDEDENGGNEDSEQNDDNQDAEGDNDGEENESDSDSDESLESEEEQQSRTKKGRILKAFEDSDEEDAMKANDPNDGIEKIVETTKEISGSSGVIEDFVESQIVSQDEVLPLAQRHASASDDLFTSQESGLLVSETNEKSKDENDEAFTQTFSILDSSKKTATELDLNNSGKLSVVCSTQSLEVNNVEYIAEMCPVTESQINLPLPSQIQTTQLSQSQPIGEDILAMCTGQFYNNQFVSQVEDNEIPLGDSQKYDAFDNYNSQESQVQNTNNANAASVDIEREKDNVAASIEPKETEQFIELRKDDNKEINNHKIVDDNLRSILDELDDPEFDSPKPNKFFVGSKNTQKHAENNESVIKKKLIIDSDDETNEGAVTESKKRRKLKKRKPEKRALQISDDEDEISEQEEIEEYGSDIEEEHPERLVEYDSEENEIEMKPQNPKKKRKMTEFFENEAELTSEDEWVGSGDEDEAGLDRMEREEGDDETFHQGKLQRELGQIHMRDVLDQDKREVRLIQELLFEDGDLGGGGRQRKFRWLNMDGNEETGTVPDGLADTQEEEFESEEQWRKQRHERETFLRQMKNKDDADDSLNISVNRTTIIKANLLSKTMSSILMEVNNSTTEKTESPVEKKTSKDIPSPKKPFSLLQQSYQGSLLSRGRGALARLAALAIPLAADDDAKVATLGPSSRRNFVFTALTPEEKEPKVTKRKAESNPSTPKLVKKMRTEDKQNTSKSLLDHFKM